MFSRKNKNAELAQRVVKVKKYYPNSLYDLIHSFPLGTCWSIILYSTLR